ncbi:MAG TPA: TRAP transporter substrate-binding protein [Candidatus Elarobacter sp.]|jgi:tripartite ATP-independent transporter DctP family solute receptor|nr:TRAP transporter substrate-binding protein [Candidatus Elarobacter sp.]
MTDRTISRARFVAGSSAAFASIAIASPARAAQWGYKYASNVSLDHPLNVRMRECWTAVSKETGGRLDVQIFPNNQLGGDTAVLQQLRSGAVQFFTLDGGILQSVVPVAGIQGVGFAFRDSAQAFAAMDGPLGNYVRDAIRGGGLYVHPKMWENGMRQITSSTHPIRTAADLSGFKIRTPAGELWVDLFKSLGASPGPLNFSELYGALQTKVFDGEENPYAIIDVGRLFEVQKYVSVTNHMWSAYHFLGNQDAWNALPHDVQAVVERNLTKYALLQRRDTQQRNDSLADKLVRRGMALNKADTSGMRAKLSSSGFYSKWAGKFGAQAWALLEKTSGKLA